MAKKYRPRRSKRSREARGVFWFLIASVVLIFGFLLYQALRPQPGMAMADLGNQHILYPQTAVYNSTPPTSGPHYENLARWGIHTEPIPNELQVHNLEDGGVMVQYDCPDGCDALVSELADIVERYPDGVILAPYPDMEHRIALTAWQRLDAFDEFDEDRIVRFIEAYRGIDHHE